MASVFKRGRWVDRNGRRCRKGTPGAKWQASKYYTVQIVIDGRPKLIRGYTDRQASEQLAAKLERAKAQGEQGLIDPYKPHRGRPLAEHVADWIAELRQLGRDDVYIGLCETRMTRLIHECGWQKLDSITPDSFIRWRQTATSLVGKPTNPNSSTRTMGARTQNHYLEALRAFCLWAVKRKRMAGNPVAEVQKVETAGKLRRQRRALTENEITALLGAVPERHQLAYRIILSTGLRRDELRHLRWGDVKLNAPVPCIQLRAETTKAKRADVLPLRADLADLLRNARGDAEDGDRVCRTLPSMESHRRYLARAGIAYEDEDGRRVDFHALRHTYGSLLAKAGVAPRVAMALMRHTDLRLTMNVYTDPRVFDMAGAVEKLPAIGPDREAQEERRTGTDDNSLLSWRSKRRSSPSAGLGVCLAGIGGNDPKDDLPLTLVTGGNRQQKSPSGGDGDNERVKGVEPSTFTLAT